MNGSLVAKIGSQESLTLSYVSGNKFVFEEGGVDFAFDPTKNLLTITESDQTFEFTKEN